MSASPRTMRAAVLHGQEDVRVEAVERPVPGPGEVLLRIEVALTCGTDLKVYRRGYHARMIVPPAVFGHEVAGVVEEVGPGAEHLAPGTRVVVANSAPCGECPPCRAGRESLCDDLLFWNGAYAEFSRIPARIVAKNLIPLGPGVSLRDAAMVEPLACALRGVAESRIGAGQSVGIIGTGAIGLMLVALARRQGARVVAAGRRPERLARASRMGAAATVSAGPGEDLGALLRKAGPTGRGLDVVVEAAGTAETCEAALAAVGKGGLVNFFAGCPAEARIRLDAEWLHYDEITLTSTFHHTPSSVREAYRLIAAGEIRPGDFITGEAGLDELPEVLRAMSRGEGLKTAIRPHN